MIPDWLLRWIAENHDDAERGPVIRRIAEATGVATSALKSAVDAVGRGIYKDVSEVSRGLGEIGRGMGAAYLGLPDPVREYTGHQAAGVGRGVLKAAQGIGSGWQSAREDDTSPMHYPVRAAEAAWKGLPEYSSEGESWGALGGLGLETLGYPKVKGLGGSDIAMAAIFGVLLPSQWLKTGAKIGDLTAALNKIDPAFVKSVQQANPNGWEDEIRELVGVDRPATPEAAPAPTSSGVLDEDIAKVRAERESRRELAERETNAAETAKDSDWLERDALRRAADEDSRKSMPARVAPQRDPDTGNVILGKDGRAQLYIQKDKPTDKSPSKRDRQWYMNDPNDKGPRNAIQAVERRLGRQMTDEEVERFFSRQWVDDKTAQQYDKIEAEEAVAELEKQARADFRAEHGFDPLRPPDQIRGGGFSPETTTGKAKLADADEVEQLVADWQKALESRSQQLFDEMTVGKYLDLNKADAREIADMREEFLNIDTHDMPHWETVPASELGYRSLGGNLVRKSKNDKLDFTSYPAMPQLSDIVDPEFMDLVKRSEARMDKEGVPWDDGPIRRLNQNLLRGWRSDLNKARRKWMEQHPGLNHEVDLNTLEEAGIRLPNEIMEKLKAHRELVEAYRTDPNAPFPHFDTELDDQVNEALKNLWVQRRPLLSEPRAIGKRSDVIMGRDKATGGGGFEENTVPRATESLHSPYDISYNRGADTPYDEPAHSAFDREREIMNIRAEIDERNQARSGLWPVSRRETRHSPDALEERIQRLMDGLPLWQRSLDTELGKPMVNSAELYRQLVNKNREFVKAWRKAGSEAEKMAVLRRFDYTPEDANRAFLNSYDTELMQRAYAGDQEAIDALARFRSNPETAPWSDIWKRDPLEHYLPVQNAAARATAKEIRRNALTLGERIRKNAVTAQQRQMGERMIEAAKAIKHDPSAPWNPQNTGFASRIQKWLDNEAGALNPDIWRPDANNDELMQIIRGLEGKFGYIPTEQFGRLNSSQSWRFADVPSNVAGMPQPWSHQFLQGRGYPDPNNVLAEMTNWLANRGRLPTTLRDPVTMQRWNEAAQAIRNKLDFEGAPPIMDLLNLGREQQKQVVGMMDAGIFPNRAVNPDDLWLFDRALQARRSRGHFANSRDLGRLVHPNAPVAVPRPAPASVEKLMSDATGSADSADDVGAMLGDAMNQQQVDMGQAFKSSQIGGLQPSIPNPLRDAIADALPERSMPYRADWVNPRDKVIADLAGGGAPSFSPIRPGQLGSLTENMNAWRLFNSAYGTQRLPAGGSGTSPLSNISFMDVMEKLDDPEALQGLNRLLETAYYRTPFEELRRRSRSEGHAYRRTAPPATPNPRSVDRAVSAAFAKARRRSRKKKR